MLKQRICIVIALMLSTPCFAQIADSANAISPLLVGEKMPQMVLMSSEKKALDIGKIFAQKPTVLIVYRGGWCPYCNLQLADLGKNEKAIIAAGYQIVALSPDNFTDLDTTKQKDSIKYLLLSDSAGLYIQKLGIALKPILEQLII
jgi:peroxiredoxin